MEFLNNSLLARLGWKLTLNEPLLWVDALKRKVFAEWFFFFGGSFKSFFFLDLERVVEE
jgi:hypothetical protein